MCVYGYVASSVSTRRRRQGRPPRRARATSQGASMGALAPPVICSGFRFRPKGRGFRNAQSCVVRDACVPVPCM
eukprot:795221-Prymnesium_polylepis.2